MPDYATCDRSVDPFGAAIRELLAAFRTLNETDQLLFAEAIAAKADPDKVVERTSKMTSEGAAVMVYVLERIYTNHG